MQFYRLSRQLLLVSCLLLASPVISAAKESGDLGKSAVQEDLMRNVRANANANEGNASAPQEGAKPASTKATPYTLTEETPADVDTLLKSVTEKNEALVAEFEALLQKDPLNPNAPEWLFRIAEFNWQTAHYEYLRERRKWVADMDSCADDESRCPEEPVAQYDKAIDCYRRILSQYPSFSRNDEVLFRLGDGLIRNKRDKEGISYLHKLTQSYPDFKDLDAAYLALGEFYFSQKNTGTAQAAYQTIIDKYPSSPYFNYAQYKLAWTYLNLGDDEAYENAIALFKRVVENIDAQYADAVDAQGQVDENKLKTGEVSFRNQALNDLSSTYAELPQGWQQAKAYLETRLPASKVRDKLEQLGEILDSRGKFEEEIELYSELAGSDPLHPHLPSYAQKIINAYSNANKPDKATETTRQYVAMFLPSKGWYRHNQAENPNDARRGAKFSENHLYDLATKAIISASEPKVAEDAKTRWLTEAGEDLRTHIEEFPNAETRYDVSFYYAYVLDELSDSKLQKLKKDYAKQPDTFRVQAQALMPELSAAAAQYQKTIDMRNSLPEGTQDEHTQVSANRQVFVYANILATSDPSWSIEKSAKTQYFKEEKRDSVKRPAEPLTQQELDFAHSAEQYAKLFPTDDDTPAFLWRSAEIYRAKNHYNEAAQQFDGIITHFPDHQYAAVSVGSMFELYNKAQNWPKIEYWAQWLIEKKNFKHYTASELENAIAFSVDNQAESLVADNQIQPACEKLLSLEPRFPQRADLYGPAILKAAATYEQNKMFREAADTFAHYIGQENAPEKASASFDYAQILVKLIRYQEAANAFSSVCELESKNISENKADEAAKMRYARSSLYAAQFYAALGQKSDAATILKNYQTLNAGNALDLYQDGEKQVLSPTPVGNPLFTQASSTFLLAELQEPADAIRTLEALNNHADKKLAGHAKVLQAQHRVDLKDVKNAKTLIDGLLKSESTLSPSDNVQVHFLQAELQYLDFQSIELEFPIKTLQKRIDQKAKSRQKAEELYKKVIQMKNANYSTASALRLAQMALEFRDAFKALPIPPELENKPEEREEYLMWLEDELIFPAEDAATSLLNYAQQITLELHTYNDWSRKAAEELAKLQPNAYPVSEPTILP